MVMTVMTPVPQQGFPVQSGSIRFMHDHRHHHHHHHHHHRHRHRHRHRRHRRHHHHLVGGFNHVEKY